MEFSHQQDLEDDNLGQSLDNLGQSLLVNNPSEDSTCTNIGQSLQMDVESEDEECNLGLSLDASFSSDFQQTLYTMDIDMPEDLLTSTPKKLEGAQSLERVYATPRLPRPLSDLIACEYSISINLLVVFSSPDVKGLSELIRFT